MKSHQVEEDLNNGIYGAPIFDVYDDEEPPLTATLKKEFRRIQCEEVYERMDNGLCIICDELDTPNHYNLKHKGIQIFVVGCGDDQVVEDGVTTKKPIQTTEHILEMATSLKFPTTSPPKRKKPAEKKPKAGKKLPKEAGVGGDKKKKKKKKKRRTRTKKMKKSHGKRYVLVHEKVFSKTWKDNQAFIRTLRTRFFGGWSNDRCLNRWLLLVQESPTWFDQEAKSITGLNQSQFGRQNKKLLL